MVKGSMSKNIIEQRIFLIRGHRVMLSPHLAELYGVEARTLVQAFKRNVDRFPEDFAFQLSGKEYENLKSQFVISSWGGARRANPYAFTEQGIAMLSSVLRSKQAIQVNIAIIRVFVKLRRLISSHKELTNKLSQLEQKISKHDEEIQLIFKIIKQLMNPPVEKRPKRQIGFHFQE